MVKTAAERRVDTYFNGVEKAKTAHEASDTGIAFADLYAIENVELEGLIKTVKAIMTLNKKRLTQSTERSEAENTLIAKREKEYVKAAPQAAAQAAPKAVLQKVGQHEVTQHGNMYANYPEKMKAWLATVEIVSNHEAAAERERAERKQEGEVAERVEEERKKAGGHARVRKGRKTKDPPRGMTEEEERDAIAETNRLNREAYNTPTRGIVPISAGHDSPIIVGERWQGVVAMSKKKNGGAISEKERGAISKAKRDANKERMRKERKDQAEDAEQLAEENIARKKAGRSAILMKDAMRGAKREAEEREESEEAEESEDAEFPHNF